MQTFGGSKPSYSGLSLGSLNGVCLDDVQEGSVLTFKGGKWVAVAPAKAKTAEAKSAEPKAADSKAKK